MNIHMRVSTPAKIKIRNNTEKALEVLANASPNLLITPSCISVFVRCGKYFYPVTDIQIKHTPYTNSCGSVDFVVDPYSFCSDPRGIKTPINGESLINFNEGGDEIESLTCLFLVDKHYEFCEPRDNKFLNGKVVSAYLQPNTTTPGCLIFDIYMVKVKEHGTGNCCIFKVK